MLLAAEFDMLPESARDSIVDGLARVSRAVSADDVEGIIGASKELIETVAKAVIDSMGGTYGSNVSLRTLASQALESLDQHPAALANNAALQRLSSSMISAGQAIAELRNSDGTGHGRARRSELTVAHAAFIHDVAKAWCRWILAAAGRVLGTRANLEGALTAIGGARVFSRGDLPAFLQELKLTQLGEEDQKKLGLAVARRWSVNRTFMPQVDVIEPLANGEHEYPAAFCEGIIEGLFLDHNGNLRLTPTDTQLALTIGLRLSGPRRERAFQRLADRVGDARPSAVFDEQAQRDVATVTRGIALGQKNRSIQRSLNRIAERIDDFRSPQ